MPPVQLLPLVLQLVNFVRAHASVGRLFIDVYVKTELNVSTKRVG